MVTEYIKLSPTENITLLVTGSVRRDIQTEVASKLFSLHHDTEQIGFLEQAGISGARARLQMAGGEFCGNAAMATAAYLAALDGLRDGQSASVLLEVSGAEKAVSCFVTAKGGGVEGTVELPLPRSVEKRTLNFNGKRYDAQCVDMKGIFHIILPVKAFCDGPSAGAALKEWSRLFESDAFGLILFDERESSIKPLVYVPSADTLVWERGCGSGSAAVGCCLALRAKGAVCAEISQPGGTITVRATAKKNVVEELSITGLVYILGEPHKVDIESRK